MSKIKFDQKDIKLIVDEKKALDDEYKAEIAAYKASYDLLRRPLVSLNSQRDQKKEQPIKN